MKEVELGLKENWRQFVLLVIVNAFVGGMVGLERSILPELATQEFQMVAHTAILSFIVVFGISKALANYYTGVLANKYGRRNILILGWILALPVPWILIYAENWNWVIFANILLGINQGFTWSSTVVMKIDLVGEKQRGLAMGLNESAGYLAVGLVAFITSWIATEWGIRPYPFYLGVAFSGMGLFMSIFLVRDTIHHVKKETLHSSVPKLQNIFTETSWLNPNLGSISQAGLVNNLNDGMIWGLLPMLLLARGYGMENAGIIVGAYPVVWGIGQLFTGKMADHLDKKKMLFWGMLLQSVAIAGILLVSRFIGLLSFSILLGVGTAIVYPTFLAGIADYTHPEQRAQSIGVFRLWRDLGYAIGAVLTGVLADFVSVDMAIGAIAGLTFLSAVIIQLRMR